VTVRDGGDQPLATWRAPHAAGHDRAGSGLVDEDRALGIEAWLHLPRGSPGSGYVRAVLLGSSDRLRFSVRPCRAGADRARLDWAVCVKVLASNALSGFHQCGVRSKTLSRTAPMMGGGSGF